MPRTPRLQRVPRLQRPQGAAAEHLGAALYALVVRKRPDAVCRVLYGGAAEVAHDPECWPQAGHRALARQPRLLGGYVENLHPLPLSSTLAIRRLLGSRKGCAASSGAGGRTMLHAWVRRRALSLQGSHEGGCGAAVVAERKHFQLAGLPSSRRCPTARNRTCSTSGSSRSGSTCVHGWKEVVEWPRAGWSRHGAGEGGRWRRVA